MLKIVEESNKGNDNETEKDEETIQKSQEQEGDGEERIGWERETNLPKSKIAEIFIAKTR